MICLINFVRWTELEANKRQHLARCLVLVVFLWTFGVILFNADVTVSVIAVVSVFISVSVSISLSMPLDEVYLLIYLFMLLLSPSPSTYGLQCHNWFVLSSLSLLLSPSCSLSPSQCPSQSQSLCPCRWVEASFNITSHWFDIIDLF